MAQLFDIGGHLTNEILDPRESIMVRLANIEYNFILKLI